jgi:putative oxidoreductase
MNAFIRTHGVLIGRVLLGLLFVVSGLGMLLGDAGVAGVAGMIEDIGLPAAGLLAWIVVLVKVLGGAGLVLGYRTEQCALALFVFTFLTIVFVHNNAAELTSALKNLSIMGGLLYVMVYGVGEGWALEKAKASETPAATTV